ncbi:MAG: A24 family peptidase [Actinomycetaceae bacterium]|nr:A24 family peptidase [Actinomycetaceae bacterium]
MGEPLFHLQVAATLLGFAALGWVLTKGYLLVGRYLVSFGFGGSAATLNCQLNSGPAACSRLSLYSGAVFLLTFILGQKDPLLAVSVPLSIFLALSAYVDYYTHKLPDKLTVLVGVSVLTGLGLTLILTPVPHPLGLLYAGALGAAVWALPLAVIYYGLRGMGKGDLKLGPLLGFWLGLYGYQVAYFGLLLAFFLGGVVALILVLAKRIEMRQRIAYGPFLALGAYFSWLAHVILL